MSETLRLEPLSSSHLPHVMTWVNDRDVMQYFARFPKGAQPAIAEDEERAYIDALVTSKTDRAYSIFDGDEYVGQCSLNQIYWPAKNGRLFVVVRREMQGRGLGRAAIARLLAIAWDELQLHKVWLIVRRDNRSAQAMYVKLGFDFEGVLRDEYFVGGLWFDMVRMAIARP